MTKKIFLISTLLLVTFSTPTFADRGGLTQTIITRYLGYSFRPINRNVFNSGGDRYKFEQRNIQMLRDRVTPMLDHFKKIYEFNVNNGVPLMNYNPTLKEVVLDKNTLSRLASLKYPVNIKWISRSEYPRGVEFLKLSFKSKVSSEQFINTITSIERVLMLKLERTELKLKKKRQLTKQEKEMLEPIKHKTLSLNKYQPYYGIYYHFSDMVEAAYFSDLRKLFDEDFANIQQNFKFEFYRSKEINLAVNSKILLNVENVVEDQDYKKLEMPFILPESKLPKSLYRITKYTVATQVNFLIAKKESSNAIIPSFKKIVDTLALE